jgi:hypothetical protein
LNGIPKAPSSCLVALSAPTVDYFPRQAQSGGDFFMALLVAGNLLLFISAAASIALR